MALKLLTAWIADLQSHTGDALDIIINPLGALLVIPSVHLLENLNELHIGLDGETFFSPANNGLLKGFVRFKFDAWHSCWTGDILPTQTIVKLFLGRNAGGSNDPSQMFGTYAPQGCLRAHHQPGTDLLDFVLGQASCTKYLH